MVKTFSSIIFFLMISLKVAVYYRTASYLCRSFAFLIKSCERGIKTTRRIFHIFAWWEAENVTTGSPFLAFFEAAQLFTQERREKAEVFGGVGWSSRKATLGKGTRSFVRV